MTKASPPNIPSTQTILEELEHQYDYALELLESLYTLPRQIAALDFKLERLETKLDTLVSLTKRQPVGIQSSEERPRRPKTS